ncbi:MAG: hypothetical protein H6817_01790 [Phycisphaerales bacterium]|nr:hypothetical protein [Phycisphaerales bacterium]
MAAPVDLDAHVRRIVAIHFDPDGGAPYWLERAEALGWDPRERVRSLADLSRLGPMDENALRERPVHHLVPLSRRANLVGAITAETGGATGKPKRTIFSRDEFHTGFVEPFVRAAKHAGFPKGATWLWVGPGGPHIIGQAAAACATALGSPQPFAIDFDPRWFRKLPADSTGSERYLKHLINQAMDVIATEPIEVIFTTPVMLQRLAEAMTPSQRVRIRGVHYGGMRVESRLLASAQSDWFPNAVHLAGYGNSLFGVCMELGGPANRELRYYPYGPRHQVQVDNAGRVWMSRLDETLLIANLPERDTATACAPHETHSALGFCSGVSDPRPIHDARSAAAPGIY